MKRREFVKLMGITSLGTLAPINLLSDGTLEFPTLPQGQVGMFQTIDLTEGVRFFLEGDDKLLLNKRVYSLVHEFNVDLTTQSPTVNGESEYRRDFRIVKHYGFRAKNLKNACRELASIITYAKDKNILGFLTPGAAVLQSDGSYICCTYFATYDDFVNEWEFQDGDIVVKTLPGEGLNSPEEFLSELNKQQEQYFDNLGKTLDSKYGLKQSRKKVKDGQRTT